MTNLEAIKKDRGGQAERLAYIETRIYWTGQFKRRYLAERFGTSPAQQSKDMVLYQELAPGNIEYDRKTWVYRILPTFKPVFTKPTPDSLLGLILSDKESLGLQAEVALLPRPTRSAPPEVVREILLAVQFGQSLHIRYQSMTKADPEDRWVTPHALAHDGCRFHARALCHASGLYKDFVLGRILAIHEHGVAIGDPSTDHDWNEIVQLHLAPHPGLLEGPRKVIEDDYGMRDGKVEWNVRRALLPYVVTAQHLLFEHNRPDYQQIILLNKKELIDKNVLQHNV